MPGSLESFSQLISASDGLFAPDRSIAIARAPARLDLMGGIADYSGSVVLEATLGRAAFCAVQLADHGQVRLRSHDLAKEGLRPDAAFELEQIPSDYRQAREFFAADAHTSWAAYLAGNLVTLRNEAPLSPIPMGVNILLNSDIPLGAGVASSAAIEVACLEALCAALEFPLEGLELARLCQITENRVVGAPCGIMDQVTCCLGDANRLLAINCRPHDILGLWNLPEGVRAVGINSNVKHAVGGHKYARARVGAFMGLKIISRLAEDAAPAHLADLTPAQFRREYYSKLPAKLSGADFIARYGDTDDAVTTVDEDETYSVRPCSAHPIYENQRVEKFIDLIGRAARTERETPLIQAGKLMYASHWSYSRLCALGAPETDLLVKLVRDRGPEEGFFGAKITGGGSGGTVAVLAREDTNEALQEIMQTYDEATGLESQLLSGSSPGSRAFGIHWHGA